jgi:hypothetical protein
MFLSAIESANARKTYMLKGSFPVFVLHYEPIDSSFWIQTLYLRVISQLLYHNAIIRIENSFLNSRTIAFSSFLNFSAQKMFLSAIQSVDAKKTYVEMLHSGKKLHLCKMV